MGLDGRAWTDRRNCGRRLNSFGARFRSQVGCRGVADLEQLLRLTNRNMIAFDLVLGTGSLVAPDAVFKALGHEEPTEDARWMLRRNAPVWLTFAAAHAVAA